MSQSFMSSLKQQHIVYVHDDLQNQLISKEFSKYTKKIDWIIRNFILDGSTSNIKTISYQSLKWRRTSIDGNSFYLWWISSKESGTQNIRQNPKEEVWEFYLRLIRPHDDNPIELEIGTIENYPQAMQMIDLDPCKDEQTQVIDNISYSDQHEYIIDSIRGNPGSGKTVTLEYAAIQLSSVHDQKIQYITYTSGLKSRAEKFFKAVDKSNNIKALTFDEFLGSSNYKKDHNLKLFQEFLKEYIQSPIGLQKLGKSSLGLWAKNEEILRIELRAYIYGISLPFNWKRGDLYIDGSKGLIKKAQYKKLRQKTDISDVELEIAYTIALALYEKQDNYKRVFPDLYYARKTLEDFIENKSKTNDYDHCDAIIIDEVQDLTLLQIALVFEKGQFYKNPNNHLAFRFIIAGDESQTLLHSGFKWDFTNNLFTSKFLNISKIPQEHPFKSNYRNPLLIAELVESTYKLYSRYTNKELTPKSSSKTDNLHENRESGKIILWQMSEGCSIPNPQKLSEDLNNLPSEIVVIDLSSKSLEKYQNFPFYYSDREIKGLEREVVFIMGLSSKIEELKQNKQDNHYIALQKNRKIIDSIRVVFSRSTKLLVIADFESPIIENEFSLLNKEEHSWEEMQSILEKELKTDQSNPLDEAFGLINIIDQTIDDGYIDRAQQYLKKVREISQKNEDKSLDQLIRNLEIKILDAQLSATKREILGGNPNAAEFFIKLTQNAKDKNIEIQSFKSFQDIKGYFDWCRVASEYVDIFEIQAINNISDEYFQNSLDLLTAISENNYFVTEKKIDLQEKTKLFHQITWVKVLRAICDVEDQEKISAMYNESAVTESHFLEELFPKNVELFSKIEKSLWIISKNFQENNINSLYCQSEVINEYLAKLDIFLSIYRVRSPKTSFVFEFLINVYRSCYPLNSIENFKKFILYINENNIIEEIQKRQIKGDVNKVRHLCFGRWLKDIVLFLCSDLIDDNLVRDFFDDEVVFLIKEIYEESYDFRIDHQEINVLKQKFSPLFLEEKISKIFKEVEIPEILLSLDESLTHVENQIKSEPFRAIDDSEKAYIISKLKSIYKALNT